MRAGVFAAALALGATTGSAAQQSVAERLAGRVPPGVAAAVVELAARAEQRGLPVEPLVQKALEGGAKGVPAERVTAALEAVLHRLGAAHAALRAGGVAVPVADELDAGAYALNAGLAEPDLTALAAAGAPRRDLAVTLRVAGTLAALGVPAAETVYLVTQYVRAGLSPADLMALPAEVRQGMARGATPAQAAAGLARAAAARRGPPRAPPHGPPGAPPGRPDPPASRP